MEQSHAAAEAWKKAVTETTDKAVAKAAYSQLYDTLLHSFTKAPKIKFWIVSPSRMVST